MFGRYTGLRFEFDGGRFIMMNDDELLATGEAAEHKDLYMTTLPLLRDWWRGYSGADVSNLAEK